LTNLRCASVSQGSDVWNLKGKRNLKYTKKSGVIKSEGKQGKPRTVKETYRDVKNLTAM